MYEYRYGYGYGYVYFVTHTWSPSDLALNANSFQSVYRSRIPKLRILDILRYDNLTAHFLHFYKKIPIFYLLFTSTWCYRQAQYKFKLNKIKNKFRDFKNIFLVFFFFYLNMSFNYWKWISDCDGIKSDSRVQ